MWGFVAITRDMRLVEYENFATKKEAEKFAKDRDFCVEEIYEHFPQEEESGGIPHGMEYLEKYGWYGGEE